MTESSSCYVCGHSEEEHPDYKECEADGCGCITFEPDYGEDE